MKPSSTPTDPALEVSAQEAGGRRITSARGALLVLMAGLVFTAVAFWQLTDITSRRLRLEFRTQAQHRVEVIRYSLESRLNEVEALQLLYEVSNEVNRDMFRRFAGTIATLPGIQALEWIPRVTAAQRVAFEAAARREGLGSFLIYETDERGQPVAAGPRAEYFPVYFFEPHHGNESAAGFDLASEPVRRAVLERARDTGLPSVTERITPVQAGSNGFGIRLVAPIYEPGQPTDTVEQRRAHLRGFVAGVFRIGELVETALHTSIPRGLGLQLLDRSAPSDRQLLYEHKSRLPAGNESDSFASPPRMGLRRASDFEFAGRQWRILVQPNDRFIEQNSRVSNWVVLFGGLVLTALVTLYVHTAMTQRRKAEALVHERTSALRDSELKYRQLVTSTGEGIWSQDAEHRTTFVNEAMLRILGCRAEAVLGKPVETFLFAEDRPDHQQRMEQRQRGGNELYERRLRRPDGSACWCLIAGTSLRDPQGRFAGSIALFTDITERKAVEAELRKSGSLNRNLVAHLPQRVFIKDRASVYVSCNPSYARDLGLEPEQIAGRDDFAFFPRELADQYRADDQAVMAGNQPKDLEEKYQLGGREIWIHTVKVPYHDAQGGVVGVLGIFEDISERKRAETRTTALRRLGMTLNEARDSLSAGQAVTDAAFQIWNWDACFLLLYDAKTGVVTEVVNMDTINGQRVAVPVSLPQKTPSPLLREVLTAGPKLILRQDPAETTGTTVRFGDTSRPSLSLMFAPICYEQASIGIISVQSYQRDAFTDSDLLTLQVLADHCAGALVRVQAQDELHASKQRLDLALEGAELGLWDLSVLKGNLATDDRFLRMMGYRPGEVNYDYAFWRKSIHPADLNQATEALHGYLAGNRPGYESEYRLRHKSGEYCWVLAKGRVIERDAAGRPLRLLGTLLDITGRKQAEQTLRESERRFASVFHASPTGVCIVRLADDRIMDLNDALANMYGYPREALLGDPTLELNAWVDRKQRAALVRRALEQGPIREATFQFRRRNAEVGEAVGSFEIIELAGERCLLLFTRDITDFNRTQAALRQAQKMEGIGHLAGGVAHHFNNILASLTLNLSSLIGTTLDLETREALREMEGQAKRAATLVRQLLAFSRKSMLKIEPCDLHEVLAALCRMLRPLLGERVILDLARAASPAWADVDRPLLEQAVMNLCLNARDAMPEGGRLGFQIETIEVGPEFLSTHPKARPGRFVCLSVTDTGCGMAEGTLQRLFEPFFTTKDVGQGTGLGLATAFGIVEQHQGWMEVESVVGQGSTFRVFLPAGSPPEVAPSLPAPDEHTGDATILLVEDEVAVRKSIARVLRRRGYRVLEAGNGKDAIALWERHASGIDLLYTDLIMPEGLSGQEMAAMLRRDKPGLKVIVSSGYSLEPLQQARLAGQSIVYLSKPCAADELTAAVRDCLSRPPA